MSTRNSSRVASNLVPLEKLREACTSNKAWVSVDGMVRFKPHLFEPTFITRFEKVYDLTEFVTQHPGGQDFILFAAGKDVSLCFPSIYVCVVLISASR